MNKRERKIADVALETALVSECFEAIGKEVFYDYVFSDSVKKVDYGEVVKEMLRLTGRDEFIKEVPAERIVDIKGNNELLEGIGNAAIIQYLKDNNFDFSSID